LFIRAESKGDNNIFLLGFKLLSASTPQFQCLTCFDFSEKKETNI
jgi:hypothetical protein